MNKEILFRGKRIIEPIKIDRYAPDGWVYGGLIEVDDEEAYILPYDISGEMYRNRPYRFRANDFEYTIMLAEVDPKTIGQFTGLTDKNGKKIFENDIIADDEEYSTFENTRKGIVKFYHGEFTSFYGQDLLGRDCYDPLYSVCKERYVIGNIYDNPELEEE